VTARLCRSEVDLARAEVNENLKSAVHEDDPSLIVGRPLSLPPDGIERTFRALVAAADEAGGISAAGLKIVGVALQLIAYVMATQERDRRASSSQLGTQSVPATKRKRDGARPRKEVYKLNK